MDGTSVPGISHANTGVHTTVCANWWLFGTSRIRCVDTSVVSGNGATSIATFICLPFAGSVETKRVCVEVTVATEFGDIIPIRKWTF
jgi:hypothetical protein